VYSTLLEADRSLAELKEYQVEKLNENVKTLILEVDSFVVREKDYASSAREKFVECKE
jgi:hypothetical protein